MQPRGKRTIWVTGGKTQLHVERARQLASAGFDVHFIHGHDEFFAATDAARPSTIIVDTYEQSDETRKVIAMISNTPELAAARCVLSLTHLDAAASQDAMSANFRDLVPWRIESSVWLERVRYALAPRPLAVSTPLCSLSMNHPAVLKIPGRLIWMNETHLRIECRGTYRLGTTLHMTGNVAKALGTEHISLTVESVHKDRLLYRYSQAIIAKWGVPSECMERALALLRKLKTDNPGPRVRVFIAINRAPWRKLAVDLLNPAQHELNVAMQRANLGAEFSYFSPDIVLFDDRVANHLKDDELQNMFAQLENDIPLLIFGPEFNKERMTRLLPSRPIYSVPELTMESLTQLAKKYQVTPHQLDSANGTNPVHFLSDHPWSQLELELSARIRSLSPSGGTLGLPFSLGSFSLARIEAPLLKKALGRDVYLKITSVTEHTVDAQRPQFNHDSDFRLTDVDDEDGRKIANALIASASEFYAKQYKTSSVSPTQRDAPAKPVVIPPPPQTQSTQLTPPKIQAPDDMLALPDAEADSEINASPRSIEPRVFSRDKERVLTVDLDFRKRFDPVIAKALALFVVAATLMGLVIYAATNVKEDSYKDHGKEYGEFFKRMKDPEYRKANPGAGWDKADQMKKAKEEPSDATPN